MDGVKTPSKTVEAMLKYTQSETAPTTIVFDVDDTLYDRSTGFTDHRSIYGAQSYMISRLNFKSEVDAKAVRDEYFEKYHSTTKALLMAQADGKFPSDAPEFDPIDLGDWWAENLDFRLLGRKEDYLELKNSLNVCPLQLVAFSNGPRKYVKRVLSQIGLDDVFSDDRLFGVNDVLPYCKPEQEAFKVVFDRVGGVRPEECIMVEDSMKNLRMAKALGMRTVLVVGKGIVGHVDDSSTSVKVDSMLHDFSVDACVEHVGQLCTTVPGLWKIPSLFETRDGTTHDASSANK